MASAIASSVPSSSRWTGPDVGDRGDVGLGDLAELGDLADARASPSPAPAPRSPAGAAQIVSGSPISVLKFSGLACTRPGSSARVMSLTEVLPVEPVIPTTGQPSSRRQRAREPLQRRAAGRGRRTPSRARPRPPARAARSGVDDRAPGARGERRRGVLAAVGALAAEAEEQVARRRPRASRSPPVAAPPACPRADDLAAGLGGDPLRRELDHAAAAPRAPAAPRGRPRGRRRGSSGPRSNSWPCSWPLPAITTVSPGSAAASASAIAARRSGSTSTSARRPRRSRRGSRR